jgi:hypothetical protein
VRLWKAAAEALLAAAESVAKKSTGAGIGNATGGGEDVVMEEDTPPLLSPVRELCGSDGLAITVLTTALDVTPVPPPPHAERAGTYVDDSNPSVSCVSLVAAGKASGGVVVWRFSAVLGAAGGEASATEVPSTWHVRAHIQPVAGLAWCAAPAPGAVSSGGGGGAYATCSVCLVSLSTLGHTVTIALPGRSLGREIGNGGGDVGETEEKGNERELTLVASLPALTPSLVTCPDGVSVPVEFHAGLAASPSVGTPHSLTSPCL